MNLKCDFCESTEVTLISGYKYCARCARKIDRTIIHTTLSNAFESITMERIRDLCTEMFGTKEYGFSMFPKLYGILHRGEWVVSERRFSIPQNEYLIAVFREFIRINHPGFYERIFKHE